MFLLKTGQKGLFNDQVYVNGHEYKVDKEGHVTAEDKADVDKLLSCPGWELLHETKKPLVKRGIVTEAVVEHVG